MRKIGTLLSLFALSVATVPAMAFGRNANNFENAFNKTNSLLRSQHQVKTSMQVFLSGCYQQKCMFPFDRYNEISVYTVSDEDLTIESIKAEASCTKPIVCQTRKDFFMTLVKTMVPGASASDISTMLDRNLKQPAGTLSRTRFGNLTFIFNIENKNVTYIEIWP